MEVYRINNKKYSADISGKGAFLHGGRWNDEETYMLYCASHRSLAMLESLVHITQGNSFSWCLLSIELPISIDKIATLEAKHLSPNWINDEDETRYYGENFIKANKELALFVPSAVVQEEYNVIINPKHTLFKKIKITENKPINIDKRLISR